MSNTDQAPAAPPAQIELTQVLVDEFRTRATEILANQAAISERQSDLDRRLALLEKAFGAVTEIRETVTDLSRRVEHVTDQLGAHAYTVQGAAQAHGASNALGQDVLGEIAKLRRDVEAAFREMNRPFGKAA